MVLFTGISNIDSRTVLAILDAVNSKKTEGIYNCEKIEKIIVFIDPGISVKTTEGLDSMGVDEHSLKSLEQITHKSDFEHLQLYESIKSVLSDLVYTTTGRNLEIQMVECSYEKIQVAYDLISREIKKIIFGKYEDHHLLFNLTPGNKNISIALALNSIHGNRRSCYMQQSGSKKDILEVEELDIFRIKDMFAKKDIFLNLQIIYYQTICQRTKFQKRQNL